MIAIYWAGTLMLGAVCIAIYVLHLVLRQVYENRMRREQRAREMSRWRRKWTEDDRRRERRRGNP